MDLKKLDDLYKLYRFELLPLSNNDIRVYSYTSKYFSNADIIVINEKINKEEIQKLSAEVGKLGFSVSVRNYKTLDEAEESLFDGFFDIKNSNSFLSKSYHDYKEKISQLIFGEYEYINSEYLDVEREAAKNDSIVDTIMDDLNIEGPVLIMVEAAAGFGKTSTSYEVIKLLSEKENTNKIPLFTELSRNRQASIFKYVLYDEINRRFTGLSLELVIKHIIEGRIPVIIDGFDELLKTKSQDKAEDKFEDAEPMLQTIKELLKGEAKILLTTRRTAIFSDDDFFSWLERHSHEFTFRRYGISPPTISDWIAPTREKLLQKAGLNITSISNPVLLSYIRSMDDEKFSECLNNIDLIIDDYIRKLMERENERQDYNMSVPEQKKILRLIAKHFTDFDITSETKEQIEKKIIDQEQALLFNVLDRYGSGDRPTMDQLINKLIIHAFLDRKGEIGQQIGFVNDFIFGSFVGENLLVEKEDWIGTERFIDFILTAYTPRSLDTKQSIYELLNEHLLEYLNFQKRIYIDNYLFGSINRDIQNEFFSNIEFRRSFTNNCTIINSVFSDCQFYDISFDFSKVSNTHFINCSFFTCQFPLDQASANNISFTNCDTNSDIDLNTQDDNLETPVKVEDELEFGERHVLEKFWPTGKERFFPNKRESTLRLGVPSQEVEEIDKAINSLIKRNILIKRRGQHSLELNIEHINEIKKILHR